MKSIVISIICLLAIGCQQAKPVAKVDKRPDWISNPKAGATGSAGFNVMGRQAQEDVAIANGRKRLAATLGVTVNDITTMSTTANNGGSQVYLESLTKQEIKNKTIKAHVRAIWHDKSKNRIWAWLYPVK